jgi:hypothetical protein
MTKSQPPSNNGRAISSYVPSSPIACANEVAWPAYENFSSYEPNRAYNSP